MRPAPLILIEFDMVKVLAGRTTVKHGLSADNYYALRTETGRELVTELFGIAVGIFEDADLYKFARVETVGEAFEHIFAYALLADLPYGLDICGESLQFTALF